VVLNGSKPSRDAFQFSLEFATCFDAYVLLLRVMSLSEFEIMAEGSVDEFTEELSNLCREAQRKGVRCKYRLDVGQSHRQIVRAAEDIKADMVVLGTSALWETAGAAQSIELSEILGRLSCPVTVVK